MMNYTIKKINAVDTFEVRHPVLREGKPLSSCFFEGDEDLNTLHFGIFDNSIVLGVASFYEKKHDSFEHKVQFQLRGMAVLKEYQGLGLGRIVLEYCENYLKENGVELIWFNARVNAIGFYTTIGYTGLGEVFEISSVGPHLVMYKVI